MFGKLRQGSGGTYFITVQQVLEKVCIYKAKLLLQLRVDITDLIDCGHACAKCGYLPNEDICEMLSKLPELEKILPSDYKLPTMLFERTLMLLKILKFIIKVYMLRCAGTPRVCTHDAFHTPRPTKITISLCKKRTSVNFEHTYFLNQPLMMICHMYHIMYLTESDEMYPWMGGGGGGQVSILSIYFLNRPPMMTYAICYIILQGFA